MSGAIVETVGFVTEHRFGASRKADSIVTDFGILDCLASVGFTAMAVGSPKQRAAGNGHSDFDASVTPTDGIPPVADRGDGKLAIAGFARSLGHEIMEILDVTIYPT